MVRAILQAGGGLVPSLWQFTRAIALCGLQEEKPSKQPASPFEKGGWRGILAVADIQTL
jgi:hypothetical protein